MSASVLIAEFPIFLQRTIDDVFQLRWQIRIQPHGSRRSTVHDPVEDHSVLSPRNGSAPVAISYMDRSEGEQITARIQFPWHATCSGDM